MLVQVREDLLDHHRILDAGDDPDGATARPVGLHVDAKYALQALRIIHRSGNQLFLAVSADEGLDTYRSEHL